MSTIIQKIETWFYQQSIQKRLVYVGFIGVFFAVFALNYFFPIYADDMLYSVVKFQDSISLGDNLKEIGEFMHYYYFNWGGRVVAHIAAHLLLMFGAPTQALINSLVFCYLIYLIYRIGQKREEHNLYLSLFIGIAVFYFTPSFLSSAVWKTGSANYLWTTTVSLAFLYPYYKLSNGYESKDSIINAILFFFFGILAAWSNENTGPTLFLLVVALLGIIYFRKKKQVPLWAILGMVGVIVGCCLMILAPGNAVRAEAEGYTGLFSSIDRIPKRLTFIYASYRHFMLRPIIIYVVCLILHHYYAKDKEAKNDRLIYSLIFFVVANISIWLTVLAPSFPPRAFFIITVLTVVAIAILYANLDFRKMLPKVINLGFLAVLIFYASIDYLTYLKGTYFLHREMNKREAIISESLKEGKTTLKFESIYMDYRFEYTDFANYYKDYYGVDVTFVDKLEEKE